MGIGAFGGKGTSAAKSRLQSGSPAQMLDDQGQ